MTLGIPFISISAAKYGKVPCIVLYRMEKFFTLVILDVPMDYENPHGSHRVVIIPKKVTSNIKRVT